jgi:RNase H-fold protein (predicted Holliday junction resolvase)
MNTSVVQLDSYKKTRIQKEIHDLNDCIAIIDWNIDQKVVGLPSGTKETIAEQAERREQHCNTIAELTKQLEAL